MLFECSVPGKECFSHSSAFLTIFFHHDNVPFPCQLPKHLAVSHNSPPRETGFNVMFNEHEFFTNSNIFKVLLR